MKATVATVGYIRIVLWLFSGFGASNEIRTRGDLAQRSGIYSRDRKFPPIASISNPAYPEISVLQLPIDRRCERIFGEVIMNARLNYHTATTLSSILRPTGTLVEPWDQTLNTSSSRASLSMSSSLRS